MGCPYYSYLWILSRMIRRKLSVTSSCGFKLSCLVKRHLFVWWADTFRRGRNVINVCWLFVIRCWNDILKPWTGVLSLFAAVFRDVTQRSFRGALRDIPKDGFEGDYRVLRFQQIYLTIVPRLRMGSESKAYEAENLASRSKKLLRQNIFLQLQLDFNPFLSPKHYKYGRRFSLLVDYNI